jgi:hypothetical protein
LAVEGRHLVARGRAPWLRFVGAASNTEKALALRVLGARARLNGRRAVLLWR